MTTNVLVKPSAIYDPRPGVKSSPLSHRCIFADNELEASGNLLFEGTTDDLKVCLLCPL